MPTIKQVTVELQDGETIDVSKLFRGGSRLADNLELDSSSLPTQLKCLQNKTRFLTCRYEALGRMYQSEVALKGGAVVSPIYLDNYAHDVFDQSVLQKSAEFAVIYAHQQPFRHVVIDNLFDSQVLETVVAQFPNISDMGGRRFNDRFQKKSGTGLDLLQKLPPYISDFLLCLNTHTFCEWLSQVSGLFDLIPDPFFKGGGLHQSSRGGKLDVHIDFNKLAGHPYLKNVERRLNLIVFLNPQWREEFGGHLEFWEENAVQPEKRILPTFNKTVIFEATSRSFHGHPHPLKCPSSVTRKSVASYYYKQEEDSRTDFQGCAPRQTQWLAEM